MRASRLGPMRARQDRSRPLHRTHGEYVRWPLAATGDGRAMALPSDKPERTTNRVRPALLGLALIALVIALVGYAALFTPH